jgi:hypothetical protein
LNRLVISGKIVKLSKGKFYKPETTVFGILQPDQAQVVKDLLEKNGKITGYLTGYSIYNQLGLTTQVSNTIQIGKNEIRSSFKRGRYAIHLSSGSNKDLMTESNSDNLLFVNSEIFCLTMALSMVASFLQ